MQLIILHERVPGKLMLHNPAKLENLLLSFTLQNRGRKVGHHPGRGNVRHVLQVKALQHKDLLIPVFQGVLVNHRFWNCVRIAAFRRTKTQLIKGLLPGLHQKEKLMKKLEGWLKVQLVTANNEPSHPLNPILE